MLEFFASAAVMKVSGKNIKTLLIKVMKKWRMILIFVYGSKNRKKWRINYNELRKHVN